MGRVLIGVVLAVALAGCNNPPPAATTREGGEHDHGHDRGKMMLADAGPYHAALTAHLSKKDGNELDLFFETAGKEPKPVPLPLAKVTATAATADGKAHELVFEPAPKEERKGDPDGQCSHFVAKAPWMTADDILTVTATVEVKGRDRPATWKGFRPRKYAHHDD